jgi:hypothetical protein
MKFFGQQVTPVTFNGDTSAERIEGLARSEIHLTEEISGRRMRPIALCSWHLLHRSKERCSCSQSERYPFLMV